MRASTRDLFTGFDQLDAVRDLLLSGSPVKARMALILLDGLADSMLFRRLEDLYEAGDDRFQRRLFKVPRYTSKERMRARLGFNRRVELARQRLPRWYGDDGRGGYWLYESEADILKACHTYRNDAYHEDRHNPAVVDSIARLLFSVVARLLARLQPAGVSHGSTSAARIERLADWGYETGSMLNVREAADAVADHLIADLPIEPAELRGTLADDLDSRVESLRDDVRFLTENIENPGKLIEGLELSARYGADEELVELEEVFDPLTIAGEDGSITPSDEWLEQARAAAKRHLERMNEIERAHKQRVTFSVIERAEQVAARLGRMPDNDAAAILATYHAVDLPLTELEEYVLEAVYVVDREIQLQIDIARGK